MPNISHNPPPVPSQLPKENKPVAHKSKIPVPISNSSRVKTASGSHLSLPRHSVKANDILTTDIRTRTAATHNRLDKKQSGLAHTVVVMKTPENQYKNAKLLNTQPDKLLLERGLTPEQINCFPVREKTNNTQISEAAIQDAGLSPSELPKGYDRTLGRYLGQGGFGLVKFALIRDEEQQKNKVVVCKKIKMPLAPTKAQHTMQQVRKEIQLQHQAGDVAVAIYGSCHTVNKDNQPEYLVFMDIAPGESGAQFFEKYYDGSVMPDDFSLQEVALNTGYAIKTMHERGVIHADLKWGNIQLGLDLKAKILDFGLACAPQEKKGYGAMSLYMAPEAMTDGHVTEKMDIFSFGIMLIDVFRKDHKTPNPFLYGNERWEQYHPKEMQTIIDDRIQAVPMKPKHQDFILQMCSVNPDERPSMDDVIRYLEENL